MPCLFNRSTAQTSCTPSGWHTDPHRTVQSFTFRARRGFNHPQVKSSHFRDEETEVQRIGMFLPKSHSLGQSWDWHSGLLALCPREKSEKKGAVAVKLVPQDYKVNQSQGGQWQSRRSHASLGNKWLFTWGHTEMPESPLLPEGAQTLIFSKAFPCFLF